MKTLLLIILCCLLSNSLSAQIVELEYNFPDGDVRRDSPQFLKADPQKPEVLNQGFVDFFSSGSMQATAKIIQLNIGETGTGKIKIPIYLFVGASGKSFGENSDNQNTIDNLLNPIGGIFNLTVRQQHKFKKGKKTKKRTYLKWAYQLSGKMLHANDTTATDKVNFGSAYGSLGLFFQTGAWDIKDKDKGNIGLFWIYGRAFTSYVDDTALKDIWGTAQNYDPLFYGLAFDLGIDIENKLDLKFSYYQHFNNEDIDNFTKPVFKFAFDHSF